MNISWTPRKAATAYCLIILGFFLGFFIPLIFLVEEEKDSDLTQDDLVTLPEEVPDFASIEDVRLKKQMFFDYIEPYVDAVNKDIIRQRERVLMIRSALRAGEALTDSDHRYISTLAEQYELEAEDYTSSEFINVLLRRVDKIPASLALAQAANESAWGTSRFAQDGNNFFGQWCYTDGCGIVPSRRREGTSHEVRRYENVRDSVEAYIHNLNTFPSYQMLRRIRQQLRRQERPVDGISLADGLESYSSRGHDYIDEVQRMIFSNNLLTRDNHAL